MKYTIILSALLLFSIEVLASPPGKGPRKSEPASMAQLQGQIQGQAQTQTARSNSNIDSDIENQLEIDYGDVSSDSLSSAVSENNNHNDSSATSNNENNVSNDAALSSAVDVDNQNNAEASDVDISIEGDSVSYDIPVASAHAPQAISRYGCSRVIGFGTQGEDRAVSLGIPIPSDSDCKIENAASMMNAMGYPQLGMLMLCESSRVRNAFGSGSSKSAKIKSCKEYMSSSMGLVVDTADLQSTLESVSRETTMLSSDLARLEQENILLSQQLAEKESTERLLRTEIDTRKDQVETLREKYEPEPECSTEEIQVCE